MASRQTFYAEDLTGTNTTTVYPVDALTLTYTPDANSDYFEFASMAANTNSTTIDLKTGFFDTTGSADLTAWLWDMKDATDYMSMFSFKKFTFGASPPSQTRKLRYGPETGGTTTTYRGAAICSIKADSQDQYAESDTESTTSSSTYQDKTTLTFTPATQGDYLILACAQMGVSSTSVNVGVKLNHSSGDYGTAAYSVDATTTYGSWGTFVKLNLTAASHTFKIQYNNSTGANTAKIKNARIVAIRLDTIDNNYYAESRTRSTTTSTTYQDKTTLTQTPQNVEHLLFATGVYDNSGTAQNSDVQFIETSTTIQEVTTEAVVATTTKYSFMSLYRKTLAASSTTWKTQYKSESTNTTGIAESAIAILQTAANPAGGSIQQQLTMMGVGV